MKRHYLSLVLLLLPFWGCAQDFNQAPYQVEWSIFPFVNSLRHVTEMRISSYEWSRNGKELELQGWGTVEFDSLGRSWVSHPELDTSFRLSEYVYGMSYNAEGCPEYRNAKPDSSGWVVFSKMYHMRNHCRDGLIDTFITGDTLVVHFDTLRRRTKVQHLARNGSDPSWIYSYDSLGRTLRITGPSSSSFTYPTDSIVMEYLSEFQERSRTIFVLGRKGLPINCRTYEYRRRGRPMRLVGRREYEYDWRDE